MFALRLGIALTACLFAAAPLQAQPAVELEGYFAKTGAETADASAASLPFLPAVCALAPDRIAIAGAAERPPSTARDDIDANVHVLASAPNLPRR